MNSTPKPKRGFSLVELMVALVAGLIVSYAVVAFAMASMKSNAEYVQSSKLTQSLRNTLDFVHRDLRRAGYDENSIARLAGGGDSPFAPMLINSSCVVYAYDRPGANGGALERSNGEVRAIRRVSVTPVGATSAVGVIEYGISTGSDRPQCGDATATYTSYPPSCNGMWCPLSDASTVNITGFTLTETSSNPLNSTVRIRNVDISLQGRLVGDDGTKYLGGVAESYTRGLRAGLKVRSDCVRLASITNCNVSP